MNIREFNRYLRENSELKINNRVDEIDLINYLPPKKRPRFNSLVMIKVFTSLIIVFVLTSLVYLNLKPTTVLSFEFNPEIEVKLNVFNRVVGIESKNEDAVNLVENLKFKFRKLDEVMQSIYDYSVENGYTIDGELYILIGVEGLENETKIKLERFFALENVKTLLIPIIYHSDFNFSGLESLTPTTGEYDDNDSESISGITQEGEISRSYLDLAEEANVSETRLSLITAIYFQNSDNQTQLYFEYLLQLELYQLFDLYEGE